MVSSDDGGLVPALTMIMWLCGAVVAVLIGAFDSGGSVGSGSDDECGEIDWDNLGFGIKPTDYMYVTKCTDDGLFEQGQLNRYGNIELNPSAGVLNYGQSRSKGRDVGRQKTSVGARVTVERGNGDCFRAWVLVSDIFGVFVFVFEHYGFDVTVERETGGYCSDRGIFEGTKAFRREDGGLFLFRPDQNAIRMQYGADRMCMPSPSIDQFIDGVKQTALANRRWIPPPGKGSLYIRPLLIGSGPILGLSPAPEYTFLVYSSPVGNYFKNGLSPLNLYIEDEFHRATRGGVGGVKSITNYAPVLKALTRAKSRGFSDVIYLDSVHKKYLEEATSCNVFVVKGNHISTPPTSGNILPGITRKTVIDIARDHGYQVEERAVPVEEFLDGDEVFCTGTAVSIVPVGSITYLGKRVDYKTTGETVSRDLYSTLIGIQSGLAEDKKGWFLQIE
ncbi:branched-chain amino acid transaminase 2 [Actinidia rufa]|uniref:Branched-chain-amino-acid aminotransferase n=1 Tax=Actinidia rufa TaxID=165716 RepID=A0A7J0EHP1_9ERIC|nr:branched-chain amino acid transaminase 2 [Actinidia rufa]